MRWISGNTVSLWGRIYDRLLAGAPDRGASLVEYTFLILLVAIVALGSLRYFGLALSGHLGHSTNAIRNAVRNGS